MRKKLILTILAIIAILSATGAYAYYRVEKLPTCGDVFNRYKDKNNIACVVTTRGVMVFELYPDAAPKSINRFKKLANENKFYDGLQFYRVAKDFVVQGGIQDYQVEIGGTETKVNDQKMKYKITLTDDKVETEANFDKLGLSQEDKDTITSEGFKSNASLNSRPFDFGSLSFANAGPDTNSTEIFIVSSKDPKSQNVTYLNGRFTNFGKIIEGSNVLEDLNKSEINKNYPYSQDKPLKEIKILEVRVK